MSLDGSLPAAPICGTLGFRLVEVEEGRAVFEGEPGEHLFNPMGTVHGGFMATLLDSALGTAVMSALPSGRAYTTVQLGVNLVRPVFGDTPTLRCEGTASMWAVRPRRRRRGSSGPPTASCTHTARPPAPSSPCRHGLRGGWIT